jgi:DtxR family Mn-dependent transcriptional regulator
VISDDVEARLVELLGDPATCPHGNPIPGSHSPTPSVVTRRLAEVDEGEEVRLLRVSEEVELNLGTLTLLDEGGFIPGVVARVGGRDVEGNVEVTAEGGTSIHVSAAVSDRLFVGAP